MQRLCHFKFEGLNLTFTSGWWNNEYIKLTKPLFECSFVVTLLQMMYSKLKFFKRFSANLTKFAEEKKTTFSPFSLGKLDLQDSLLRLDSEKARVQSEMVS